MGVTQCLLREVQVGANVNVSNLAYADDIVILSGSYSETQGLLVAINRHAAAEGMCINVPKATVMSALIPGARSAFSRL